MNLNERISKIIEYSELTSSEFADSIEVQRSSISHITSGRNKPSLDFLIKVKDKFPELEWEWLITGRGEMKKEIDIPEEKEKTKPTALPDLFSLIEDEDFGKEISDEKKSENTEREKPIETSRELDIAVQPPKTKNIDDSQPLGITEKQIIDEISGNQKDKVKRIVLFYESGKFESFEPN